jgi:peptide/nickel transport system substrate-binding protein
MKKRNLFLVCTVVLLSLAMSAVFAAGVGEKAPASVQKSSTLTLGVSQEAVGLDPHIVTAFSSMRRIDLLYNRLVRLNENMEVVPDLAESWDIPNNLTYIFHLRKGVKFHNGRELVADDVKYSLERVLDPKTASPGRSYIATISKIEVLDAYTVKITLASPLASLLDALTSNNISIVPREVVEEHGNLQRVVCGTGPYMLENWVVDNSMTLVKNPEYFEAGLPKTEKVIFRVIPEEASLLAGIKGGNLDIATINDGAAIRQASADKSVVVMSKPGMNVRVFSFNNKKAPFDDIRVRQAIALAIDRNEILTMAEYGMGAATGPLPISAKAWAIPPEQLPFGKTDYAKAKQLLAEAGYPNGLSFDIVCSSTYEGGLAVAQVIQDQLKNIGIQANLDVVEWGNYIDRWVKRDFATMVELRGGSSEPDRFLYRSLHSTGGVNNFMYADKETDALLELGRAQTVIAERKATYDKVQNVLATNVPLVFLYSPNENQVTSPYVQGFKLVGNGSLFYVTHAEVIR